MTKIQQIQIKLQELLDGKIKSFTLEEVSKNDYLTFDKYVKRSYEVHLCNAKKKFPKNTFKQEKYTGLITLIKNE